MSEETPAAGAAPKSYLLRNWLSMVGLIIVTGSVFSFILLFLLDSLAHASNPYLGLLTYVVSPAFFFFGAFLVVLGVEIRRRKIDHHAALLPPLHVDFSRPRDRRVFGWLAFGTVGFLLLSAMGSYQTYNYTESVQFCGQACHTVMKPELITYQHGPHARVACAECHIGKGATWFVRSKLAGTYQLYATAFDKYPKPIGTPIKNLRPAQETCEECHWPSKFVGKLERTYNYHLSDQSNSPYSLSLLIDVGGGDPTHGQVGGIHWHMNVGNKIEYIASDAARQKIPWVRVTDLRGVVTIYKTKSFTNDLDPAAIRRMDCMDCHNRPAHRYTNPDDSIALAIESKDIDSGMPWIKTNAVYALTRKYKNEDEALQGIATFLDGKYPGDPHVTPAIKAVQKIYSDNFFPEMNASWKTYPENLGHKNWPGCFRCHDGKHLAGDGVRTIASSDCNACHTILAQGVGDDLRKITPAGQKFNHPGGDYDNNCADCHSGDL
jgi:nitrate/TMAO reductase-like tetraheme cytochrome c subunit